ncbi:hypothetical protein DPMN_116872 [Dreissena polymorpha]|uniref:Uncharacterized protein n=1 Tax=Dreissena polymorpha TaxID=45954 RepID=A0A9D4KQ85_DREPO|nr:hypothetical protein DPMN_116872 [Dreissena polymorpha]
MFLPRHTVPHRKPASSLAPPGSGGRSQMPLWRLGLPMLSALPSHMGPTIDRLSLY